MRFPIGFLLFVACQPEDSKPADTAIPADSDTDSDSDSDTDSDTDVPTG